MKDVKISFFFNRYAVNLLSVNGISSGCETILGVEIEE